MLLSLLVLSGVVVAGFTVGDLLLRDFMRTRRTDEAVTAFYAAESGIEQGLYAIRKTDAQLLDLAGSEVLPNNSSYLRTVTDEVPLLTVSLLKEDSFSVDLFNPDNPASGGGVDSPNILWEDSCNGCSWVEVGYVEWSPEAGINWTENFTNLRYPAAASPVNIAAFQAAKAYRVRFTAHYGDVKNLTINALAGEPGVPTPIKNAIVTMNSRGLFGRTAQVLQATFARQAPLQKIFDFVAFSECSIVKDGAVVCP